MNKDNVCISIIIPVYNVSLYIGRCLLTCINQTYENIEIVVVNDGSTDGSIEIIEEYRQKDYRILLINQENKGVNIAREVGLKTASGIYVFFLDGDDYLDEDALEIMYEKIIETDSDFVECGYKLINGKNEFVDSVYYRSGVSSSSYEYWKDFFYRFSIWGILIKKKILFDLYFENIPIGEDAILKVRIVSNSSSIININNPLYNYVRHEGAQMNSSNTLKAEKSLPFVFAVDKIINEDIDECIRFKLKYAALQKIGSIFTYSDSYLYVDILKEIITKYLFRDSKMIRYMCLYDKVLFCKLLFYSISVKKTKMLMRLLKFNIC